MTSTATHTVYDDLKETIARSGTPAALAQLAARLKADGRLHELFDARLMEFRHKLGLSISAPSSIDDLPGELRTQMENAYLDACKEVGRLFLDSGKIQEAWMYLRPVGDKQIVAQALDKITPDAQELEPLLNLTIHEGVHPRLGFQWLLKHYGTCNAITRFEAAMYDRPRADQQQVASLLLRHLHGELLRNVQADITRQAGAAPAEKTLEELVEPRDWLFAENNYHIDTSHLNAVVRFARFLEDQADLALALDLTAYGQRLGTQYHFRGEEPFADVYTSHALYFGAILGKNVIQAVEYFRDKAESLPVGEHGTLPAESYIALLSQLGRAADALEAFAAYIPAGTRTMGFCPGLLDLGKKSGQYPRLLELCQERGDVLGYAAALAESASARTAS